MVRLLHLLSWGRIQCLPKQEEEEEQQQQQQQELLNDARDGGCQATRNTKSPKECQPTTSTTSRSMTRPVVVRTAAAAATN